MQGYRGLAASSLKELSTNTPCWRIAFVRKQPVSNSHVVPTMGAWSSNQQDAASFQWEQDCPHLEPGSKQRHKERYDLPFVVP